MSITDLLDRHSTASGVSGVTESTPSALGGDLSLVEGAPAVSASFSRCCELDLPAMPAEGRASPPRRRLMPRSEQ